MMQPKEITAALDGFEPGEIGAAIDRLKSGGLSQDAYATARRNGLRLLQTQLTVLQTAVASAARASKRKVAGAALLDQAAYTQRAKVQRDADGQLLDMVTGLVGEVRSDAEAAAPDSGGGDGPSDGLKPIDLLDLRNSLERRASSEDKFAAAELEQIGGQRSEADGGLDPVNLRDLKNSLERRASSEDKFATAELKQISGQRSEGSA